MKKCLLVLCAALMLTGCGAEYPEMTEEQHMEVAKYAVGLLMKYDEHHNSRLLSDAELEKELQRLEALFVRKAELAEMDKQLKEQKEEAKKENSETNTSTPDLEAYAPQGQYVEDFYGLEGVSIRYQGYHVADAYPESEDEIYFRMQATEGNKLLVVDFVARNDSGTEASIDMISVAPRFKVGVNGEPARYALSTLLSDDLANYRGTLAAGEEMKMVIMAEVPEETADAITSVSVIMQNGANSATILMD